MKVGIGLPASIPGVATGDNLEWAKKADAGPFSSLSMIDRIVYPNYEPLIMLGAAAAVTTRVQLMTSVLLAPTRNTAILAKQSATLDVLSGGRFTLGIGIGGRQDDGDAASITFKGRGKYMEQQIAAMKRAWAGQPLSSKVGAVGPAPVRKGGPELLIGAYAPAAVRRAGRLADGFMSGGMDAASAGGLFRMVEEAWKAAGRRGKPRLVGCRYYALGPDSYERGAKYLLHYYAFAGAYAETIAKGMITSPGAIRSEIKAFADIGADELCLWPCIPELDQLDRLAEVVG